MFLLLGAIAAPAFARGGGPVGAVVLPALSVLFAAVNPTLLFPHRPGPRVGGRPPPDVPGMEQSCN
ncbi:hypothetical protein ACF058_13175 [Streptomyces sp. NPDC015501]|uniref:hypothetical protein n=1 Tax=unclassified Streptomyces TaxID=2593676 RepID=UPI00119E8C3C|nr:hypothetical protein A3L22_15245 [Streptomyces griseus subsp. griseus]